MKKIKVGVVGLGYWGPNLVRNFQHHDDFEMVWGCDISDQALNKIKKAFPHLKLTKRISELLQDPTIDLVAIATPPETHFKLGQSVLKNKKHLWIEKPFTTSFKEASKLLNFAKKNRLYLHVDLPYIFSGPIVKIKELLDKKAIGMPYYFSSVRTNLGLIQKNTDVILDLAPHDLSIIYYLFPKITLKKIHVEGSAHLQNTNKYQIANLAIHFKNGFIAYIHLSWLSPTKLRLITIGGKEKMILFDDLQPSEKVKIYDKNIQIKRSEITPFKPIYRTGDVWTPAFEQTEALYKEIEFLQKKLTQKKLDYFTAEIGLKILKTLEKK